MDIQQCHADWMQVLSSRWKTAEVGEAGKCIHAADAVPHRNMHTSNATTGPCRVLTNAQARGTEFCMTICSTRSRAPAVRETEGSESVEDRDDLVALILAQSHKSIGMYLSCTCTFGGYHFIFLTASSEYVILAQARSRVRLYNSSINSYSPLNH